ncbi:MAG: sigma 54-interacting transcriptional regulator [Deltaproteobacteria bacterium]|nr:sigma 54-interacting transcriptional regulator [Deltaproteobacteria bacterium]MBW2141427.1 sigma 54-interacting transcriptional regulator [Deltaproteobacteria bacterium]MBW2323357.1 sigma 54-interacting transcriptional regulator [Deltaproteobacteria bacterium]
MTDPTVLNWQAIVNTLAQIMKVPAALIGKVDIPFLEVICTSDSEDNPYHSGLREQLLGTFCGRVVNTKNKLLVPNALADEEWSENGSVKCGLISYLGYPLMWPDGEVFGALCVLDSKENEFGKRYEELMLRFKELIEAHLGLMYKNLAEKKKFEGILDSLNEGIIAHDIYRRITFFSKAAEEITGYKKEDVIGVDCYDAFGGAFCGGHCSFQESPPRPIDHLYHPLNVLTRYGEPRRLEMSKIGNYDDTGNFTGIIASFRDVTDLIGLKIQLGDLKGFAGIVGRAPKMLQIYRQIRDLGTSDYTVHITGDTGTGKEMVALAIHNESRRGGGPFVPVNCAALPGGLIESELFGHVKGAFTGALRDKKGRFELADGGTLFLDEVADLPKDMQAKLLRVLQEGIFERVGDEKHTSVDVRIISATNRNLKREVERGNFREDLFYRINVVPIHLPLLRERKNDIPLLVAHLLDKALEEGQETPGLSREALEVLMDYAWPGNVRELQSALRFALVKAKGRVIQPGDLPPELEAWQKGRSARGPSRKLDPESVRNALFQSGGNKVKAAKILGVGRATLYRFLSDYPSVS